MPSVTSNSANFQTTAPVGQVDGLSVPRYAGHSTFARLPRIEDVPRYDVAVVGIPFDTGVTYRPGARFGPAHIRQSSRLLRPYNPALDVEPFARQQVVDAGDIAFNPFDIDTAVAQIETSAYELIKDGATLVTLGGDHTIAYPLLKAVNRVHGPVALVHFDAHLDTWDTYFETPLTHGTPFRRAAEDGLFVYGHSAHVGIRGSLYSPNDLASDAELGFQIVHCREFTRRPIDDIIDQLRQTIGETPLYVSIDIDVLDPAHAPATGTPEAGGMTSRELLDIIRGFDGLNLVGADIVEVSPAYDHAEITGVAAANLAYEFTSLLAKKS
ncbi:MULTISPECIES: agmatinase [Rhodococcus]|uniref:Agmatinase n=1 Tax=Rhodococcus wratislaviensis NBRC 100605 TaxID=1219028 RepID=X0PST1_RHOWR|nr:MULTISPECIES: agmatinase [Rhodococcus]WAM16942.1 agmatinase [Rhodococcus sp. JS3073]GAF46089.1 agmatinase [Rhodococcus wratislaviensis NBRC 100605]